MDDEATQASGEAATRGPRRSGGGRVLGGRYRILAMLGRGGMGSVFLAFDTELGERVAVKMLNPELVADAGTLGRFRSEVRLARRVTHKNVARTYDIGEDGDARFLTMEYIEGESLATRARRDGALPLAFLVGVAQGIATGLAAAHEAGVIHRDLKLQNVMLARDGRVVLTDFGIALARGDRAQLEEIIGTPGYMAPEQIAGDVVDERTDLFALGVVLYRMATGRVPFVDERPETPPDPCAIRPTLPASFGAIVTRCLASDPARRFASAEDVRRALAEVPLDVEAAPPTTIARDFTLVEQLDVTGRRLVALLPVEAPPELAEWLGPALEDVLGANALVALVRSEDRRAEVAVSVSVRGTDEALDAVIELRSAADGRVFWEAEVGARTVDVAGLPEAIAAIVEAALAVDVPTHPEMPPLPRASVAPFLRARTLLATALGNFVANAFDLLTTALASAPDHPAIVSARAYALSRTSFWDGTLAASARTAAEEAVALAPYLADSHLALASVGWQACDPVAVTRALRGALAVAPGNPHARHMLSQVLIEAGAPGAALRMLEDVIARAPHLHRARVDRAHLFALRGRYDLATQSLESIPPGHADRVTSMVWSTRHAFWQGDIARARRLIADAESAQSPFVQAFRSLFGLVLDGRPSRLFPENPILAHGEGVVPRRLAISAQFAIESDAYNRYWDDAIARLEIAVADGLQDAFWLDRCPVLDEIRGWPRFEALRRTVQERAARAIAAVDEVPH